MWRHKRFAYSSSTAEPSPIASADCWSALDWPVLLSVVSVGSLSPFVVTDPPMVVRVGSFSEVDGPSW